MGGLSLSDLRILVAGTRRLTGSLPVGMVLEPRCARSGERVDFALIETGVLREAGESDVEGIVELAARSTGLGSPLALWVTDDPDPRSLAPLLERADAVFVADPAAAPGIAAITSRRAALVPHAASRSAIELGWRAEEFRRRPEKVVYAGRFPADGRSRQRLEALLDAAREFELEILLGPGGDPDELPERFRGDARAWPGEDAYLRSLGQARVVVSFARADPDAGMPTTAFDTLAVGAIALMPPSIVARLLVPGLLLTAATPRGAERALEPALRASADEVERAALGPIAIRNAHTYPHRIATIASALGLRVFPPVPDPPIGQG